MTQISSDWVLKELSIVGWRLQKDLQGISEPIQIEDLQGRQCLGSNILFPNRVFITNLRRILEEFISMNDNDGELQFANEFNTEERRCIHKEATKLHLTSNSYGCDGERRVSENINQIRSVTKHNLMTFYLSRKSLIKFK